jgi:hypothetical protein
MEREFITRNEVWDNAGGREEIGPENMVLHLNFKNGMQTILGQGWN